ncbi:SRPBCC family protein [Novosphingobium sp. HII-3]|uniref:SRPBCC family protein n=1 Tax=Novosphingobium sp. HII-3 TaxID=2075565 RepID=UPI001E40B46D|nr:SRPBCC family protein [Novosphingobium sp. HII-3]
MEIQERLGSLDDANRVFSYAVINDDAPAPFTDYLATVNFRSIADDACEVDWSSEFQARGMAEEDVRKIIEGAYRGVIRHLSRKAEAG